MSDYWHDPAWPAEVELQTDLEPSRWISLRLLSSWDQIEGAPVTMFAPTGYPAYVRVLHPASRLELVPSVRWREVTDWSGRTYHSTMQFRRISVPRGLTLGPPPFREPPREGHLDQQMCAVLYDLLANWTTSTDIWLGIWDGWGSLHYPHSMSFIPQPETDFGLTDLAARVDEAPTFEHPYREYLLARAPTAAIPELSRNPLDITPSLAWPDDHAWCIATEIDFDSTLVAASEECAAALLSDNRLEALRVQPEDRLDYNGDVLND